MAKKKLTNEFRAELMSALLLAADRFKRGRTGSRGICSVLYGFSDQKRISADAESYLVEWISKMLNQEGGCYGYLNTWLRGRVTDYVPYHFQRCHDPVQARKLRQTRINWIMWMYNELKEEA